MSGRKFAIRYARALYDVSLKKGTVETVSEDLSTIDEIMAKARPIRDYCLESHVSRVSETAFINIAFVPYVSQTTGEALKLASRNGRLAAVPYLCKAFKKIIEAESGVTEVVLESARKPEERLLKMIKKKIELRVGGKVRLNEIVAPELLGGIRILWKNRMIDLSAMGRLKRMRTFIKAV